MATYNYRVSNDKRVKMFGQGKRPHVERGLDKALQEAFYAQRQMPKGGAYVFRVDRKIGASHSSCVLLKKIAKKDPTFKGKLLSFHNCGKHQSLRQATADELGIVFPESIEQLSAVVRTCYEHRWRLLSCGQRTNFH